MANEMERAFEWDDAIENEGSQYIVLAEGEYPFTVVSLEKARHMPRKDGKLPACNKAVLTLRLTDADGRPVDLTYNLFLHSSQEWKLCQFFTGIGLRKRGEKFVMQWNRVVGASGVCHVKVRKYTGSDGKEHEANDIDRFNEPEATAPAWTPGAF